jgi:methyl coenzyme M reductase subunit C-like uncharacterized protein (methanogenesis marker protein 7)
VRWPAEGPEAWRGYQASKRRYFYGVKIHLVVTASGQPVEFVLAPGAEADVTVLRLFHHRLRRQFRHLGALGGNLG